MRGKYLLAAALTLSAFLPMTFAQQAASQPGGRNRPGGFANPATSTDALYKQLPDLTAEQKTKIEADYKALGEQLTSWQQDQTDLMQSMRTAMGDPDAMTKLQSEMRAAQMAREKILTQHDDTLRTILTPDQDAKWEAFKLNRDATQRLRGMTLTDEQKAKIQPLADTAGKAISMAKDDKAVAAAKGDFWKQIVDTVLTTDQVSELFANPLGGGMGGRGMGGMGGMGGGRGGPGGGGPGGGGGGGGGNGGGRRNGGGGGGGGGGGNRGGATPPAN